MIAVYRVLPHPACWVVRFAPTDTLVFPLWALTPAQQHRLCTALPAYTALVARVAKGAHYVA
jgi:hypothetical protein